MKIAESNRKKVQRLHENALNASLEKTQRRYGINIAKESKYDTSDPQLFDFVGLYNKCKDMEMREASTAGAFAALLKDGLNVMANNWFIKPVDHVYEKISLVTTSNKAIEPYAPLFRGDIPDLVEELERFPESRVEGLDVQIKNRKFGNLYKFSRELFEDDRSSQIQQKAQDLVQGMTILMNAWHAGRFIGAATSYNGRIIPASETFSGTVWSTAAVAGKLGAANRPNAYAAFDPNNVQSAVEALVQMVDPLGNKLLVQPDTIYYGSKLMNIVPQMLNSQFYPFDISLRVIGQQNDSHVGNIGGGGYNVLKGTLNPVMDIFLPPSAYAVGEAGKGLVMQIREANEVIQENPQSGDSFSYDSYNFRSRARWNTDWAALGFWYLCNDGTV